MKKPVLKALDNTFTIYRFGPEASVPPAVFESAFYWIGKTDDE